MLFLQQCEGRKNLKIKEVAKLTGITVRTLRYYDEIGLLPPSETTDAGYRLYNADALDTLQQILFFRELDFPLNKIKEIMANPAYDKLQALTKHKELLLKKRQRLSGLIELVDKTLMGDGKMSFKEFDITEIEKCKQEYSTEVKSRWGETIAYAESQEKTESYNKGQWQQISNESNEIMEAFSKCRDKSPESLEVQELVRQWQDFITDKFYKCTKEILAGLGQMYIGDERFTKNIDNYGEGTALLISKAIEYYCI